MRMYRVIYDAIEEMEQAMKGMLAAEVQGSRCSVTQRCVRYSRSPASGTVAGCYVQDGKIQRNAEVRIVRDGIVIP